MIIFWPFPTVGGSGGVSTDPGPRNVLDGITYYINGVPLRGTLDIMSLGQRADLAAKSLVNAPIGAVKFKTIQVIPLSKTPSKVLVRWEMNFTGAALADFEFYVERGQASENGPGFQHKTINGQPLLPKTEHTDTNNFHIISKAIDGLDFAWYLDYTPELLNLSAPISYRVRARKKSTQEETTSYAVGFGGGLDLVGLYVADEINFELEDVTGSPCLVYSRRRGGIPCSCFDPVQKKRTISNCSMCFGTNWLGGFFDPIDAWVDFNPNPKNALITQWGEAQENVTRVLMANFPIVYPGDIIRELRTNTLWRVGQRVNTTEKRRVTLLQFPEVVEIKPGDIEYKLPINEEFMLAKIQELEDTKKRREF